LSSKKILTIIIICTTLAFSAGIAYAEGPPNLPVMLYGNVKIDGNAAPVGTIITAKVATSPAGVTNVLTAGTYGDEKNDRLPVSASDGANVDFYVNGIKSTPSRQFTYNSKDAGKLIRVDLNAISGSSVGSGSGTGVGGTVTGTGGAIKTTTIQQPVLAKETISGTSVKGTPVTPGAPLEFTFSTILEVLGLLAIGVIVIYALKKTGKI